MLEQMVIYTLSKPILAALAGLIWLVVYQVISIFTTYKEAIMELFEKKNVCIDCGKKIKRINKMNFDRCISCDIDYYWETIR